MQLEKKYNGKTYTFDMGTYENNRKPVRIGYDHPSAKGQPQQTIARRVVIDLDDDGNPLEIVTTLENQQFDNVGDIIRSYCLKEDYRMADEELPQFATMVGDIIRAAIYSMFVRGGKPGQRIGLGHNHNRIFDPATGAFIPEEVTAEPTYDYPHDKVQPVADEPGAAE